MISSPIALWQTERGKVVVTDFIFLGSKITVDDDGSHESRRYLLFGRTARTNLDIKKKKKKKTHHFASKGPYSKSYSFSNSHVWIWELNRKEGWVPKNWCFLTVVLKKTLDNPLDGKEIKPVNPKGKQPWIFIGRTNADAPILCPPDMRRQLIGKDSDSGKDGRQKEKRVAEDEMVG